jgi:hypothetical protein
VTRNVRITVEARTEPSLRKLARALLLLVEAQRRPQHQDAQETSR